MSIQNQLKMIFELRLKKSSNFIDCKCIENNNGNTIFMFYFKQRKSQTQTYFLEKIKELGIDWCFSSNFEPEYDNEYLIQYKCIIPKISI